MSVNRPEIYINEADFVDAVHERIDSSPGPMQAMFERLQRDMVLAAMREMRNEARPGDVVEAVAQAIGAVAVNVVASSAAPGHEIDLLDRMLNRTTERAREVMGELLAMKGGRA